MMILTLKLDQYLNLTREAKQRQKKLNVISCLEIVTSLPRFPFFANLELSESRIPETYIFISSNLLSCKNRKQN